MTRRTTVAILGMTAMLGWASGARAGDLVVDDFESYVDTPQFQANWGASGAGTLELGVGRPRQSMFHPGGPVNTWVGSVFSIGPSPTEMILWEVDIHDDGGTNKRITTGLRDTPGQSTLLEMGMYSSTPGGSTNYQARILVDLAGPDWIDLNAPRSPGWHRFSALITETDITITVDGANPTMVPMGFAGKTANDLRLGGPSGVTSLGGAHFDNVHLALIPEPTALSLLALGGLAMLRRRRR